MAKYILCNRDPWNISRQKCDKNLPGAGDPPIQPGNGREYVKGSQTVNPTNVCGAPCKSVMPWCRTVCGDSREMPCVIKDCTKHGPEMDGWYGIWYGSNGATNWPWADWKKHNKVWGSLPRNKKRPNILDQNANFMCLYVGWDSLPRDYTDCTVPHNPPITYPKVLAKCAAPSHKLGFDAGSECSKVKPPGYVVPQGIATKPSHKFLTCSYFSLLT